MPNLTLYGLKNCDTCKKALTALTAHGWAVTFVDIRADTDLAVKVPLWLNATHADRLINRRSTTWRGLDEESRARDPASLLQAHPTLIKRPVIEADKAIYVGWAKDVQAQLL